MVVNAYAQGIFPMADERGRISWYAPDPRAILEHENLYISRSLRSTLRKGLYTIRMDSAFEQVMRSCAGCAGRSETWINEEFIKTYTLLHRHNLAHSVEAWSHGKLVGGLYGVALGGAFMGESPWLCPTRHAISDSSSCISRRHRDPPRRIRKAFAASDHVKTPLGLTLRHHRDPVIQNLDIYRQAIFAVWFLLQ